MNLTTEDRKKIQPFIDWLIDNKKVSKATSLYLDMEDYLKWLQKGREEVVKINSLSKCNTLPPQPPKDREIHISGKSRHKRY